MMEPCVAHCRSLSLLGPLSLPSLYLGRLARSLSLVANQNMLINQFHPLVYLATVPTLA